MPFDTTPREPHSDATRPSWLAPLTLLVAWLVSFLNSIARLKRIRAATRFKPHWIDSLTDLRRLEWHRDQLLAQGAALLLAGRTLNDADGVLSDPPDDYGGPRPRTPFQMQRRFLAITAWLKDPEGHIRRHAATPRGSRSARTRQPTILPPSVRQHGGGGRRASRAPDGGACRNAPERTRTACISNDV